MDRSLVLMTPTGSVRAHFRVRLAGAVAHGLTAMIARPDIGKTPAWHNRRKPHAGEDAHGHHTARSATTVCMHEGVAAAGLCTYRPAMRPLAIRATKTKDTRRSAHR